MPLVPVQLLVHNTVSLLNTLSLGENLSLAFFLSLYLFCLSALDIRTMMYKMEPKGKESELRYSFCELRYHIIHTSHSNTSLLISLIQTR